jgi:NAD(P)H-dependent flavin oxidoreductase YrpB (nitropropane dioxygenase family)
MALRTKLTERLGIRHPILPAPISSAASGAFAAAVSAAGGFGLIGGGLAYGSIRRSAKGHIRLRGPRGR